VRFRALACAATYLGLPSRSPAFSVSEHLTALVSQPATMTFGVEHFTVPRLCRERKPNVLRGSGFTSAQVQQGLANHFAVDNHVLAKALNQSGVKANAAPVRRMQTRCRHNRNALP
jgi:hypothetical protein